MIEELQLRLAPPTAANTQDIIRHIANVRGIESTRINGIRLLRRSIDARQRNVMVNLKVMVAIDEPLPHLPPVPPIDYRPVADPCKQAIVVGAGPAGLFAALRLIEHGVRPIVLERGKPVAERRIDVAKISRNGTIDPDSNYCFGEGGAGAFSDGKLYTRSKKRGPVERILGIFVQHGATENILIDAHPHIGSDRLPAIITAIRQTIERCSGQVRFNTRVTDLLTDGRRINGVECADGSIFNGPVILATGHSARDIYRMLHNRCATLQAKGIAVGVRLEHPQHLIDTIQYHSADGRGSFLPAAEYSFVTQVDGRGVYSFCMCPGGVVVPAASEPEQLVVNGMSPSRRNTRWANAGMVVEIHPDDLPDRLRTGTDSDRALAMMRFQNEMEQQCFRAAGQTQVAGAQRMSDFVGTRPSATLPPSSYAPGLQPSRLDRWLPPFVATRLSKGFRRFNNSARGFLSDQAVMIGVETRTSAPVRIPRSADTLCHVDFDGLYPCGEGAGYAGGIVSAAIDGSLCADALAQALLS